MEEKDVLHVGKLRKRRVPVEVFGPPGGGVGIDFVGHVDSETPAEVIVYGSVCAWGRDVVVLPVQLGTPDGLCEHNDDI
jgi:hypothetical protein